MAIKLIVVCILILAPFALWGALCALLAVDVKTTHPSIAAGFFACVCGWGGLIAAAADYLISTEPLFWPVMLLASVLALAIGNAAIYLANRRTCLCPSCPARTHNFQGARHAQG